MSVAESSQPESEATRGRGERPELTAYRLSPGNTMPIVPAPSKRTWMEATRHRFAYRCLPLSVANQAGWMVLSSHTVLATWDGGPGKEHLQIEYLRGPQPGAATSHFGQGILTWTVPYLFQTSPGYNLLMRGPANWPKDGASPLEGLIETDWTSATATMNWKLTRPGLTVRFDVGEPICMLVPMGRGELEDVEPRQMPLTANPELARRHAAWARSRTGFIADLRSGRDADKPPNEGWQKHYMHGRDPAGTVAPEHQRKLTLRPFRDE